MADLHTYKKLPSDPCLSEEKILAYIDGNLSAAEQHACEAHMADCAMCEDAAEGLALVKDRSRLAAPLKTESAPAEGKVIPLHKPNRKLWYAAAAVLVIVLGSTFLLNIVSEDGVSEGKDMAYNSEAQMDSTSVASGENGPEDFKSLERSDCLKNMTANGQAISGPEESEKRSYKVTVTDANGAMDAEQPVSPPMVAEAEEGYVMNEKVVVDEIADKANDGDVDNSLGAKPEAVMAPTKDQSGKVETVKEENKEKKNLLDFADGVAGGTKKRAEVKSKQDGFVNENRDDTKPGQVAGNTGATINANTQPNVAQTEVYTGGSVTSFDVVTDSVAVTLSEVSANSPSDTAVVADQLELSYQNGLSMLNAGQTANAILMFEKVLANKNHARYEDAEFQKANALIKANRKEEAKTLLKAIEAKKGKHAAEATELLKTL